MEDKLRESKEIIDRAIRDNDPYAIVLMLSGGKAILAAWYTSQALGVKIDYILHGHTGTGIQETTDFVRRFAQENGRYIEADAGNNYENYVLRKGFFGQGRRAHEYAYHVLKHGPFRKAISQHIRQRKRGRRILLLNGARLSESENRRYNLSEPTNADGNNIWVNAIHTWSRQERDTFLADCKAACNPVTVALCRSGECMCGTMQSQGDRAEASILYPAWGAWLNGLESRVKAKHGWGWGESMPKHMVQQRQGQLGFDLGEAFLPMCVSCKLATGEEDYASKLSAD